MNDHKWHTEESHANNSETMSDYLDNEMDPSWEATTIDGSYAEIMTDCGICYQVNVVGDGDSNNHKVSFEII